MPLELTLIQWEKFSEIISVYAVSLFLKAIHIAKQIENIKSHGKKPPPGLNSSTLIAAAFWLQLIDRAILTEIAFIRFNELKKQNRQSEQKTSLEPNIKITNGYALIIIGTLLAAIGAQERANMQQPITII